MTSRERVLTTLGHLPPDRVPVDFGGSAVTGMHASSVAALRDYYGLEKRPVRVVDPGQMLGEVDEDLKRIVGIDTESVFRRVNRFGFANEGWKPWRMDDGLDVLVPGGFNVTRDPNGDTLMHPRGDPTLPPSARMPAGGYFFDAIIRQDPIDEDALDPADNLEEFTVLGEADLVYLENEARRARATGRAVVASLGGTAFGDIAWVPGVGLPHPKGIRDVAEWYMSIVTRRDYIEKVFAGQCDVALANLAAIAERVKDLVDVAVICGTDFGTQTGQFCSIATFKELWMPYYRRINDWIHANTPWKTFKHSCGAVENLISSFLEAGFDILNPVQCSAAGMDPRVLKERYGRQVVFWGGGVETQTVLAFGRPEDVRKQVLERCETFAQDGGFVFTSVHNVQARTPVENLVALIDAIKEFNG